MARKVTDEVSVSVRFPEGLRRQLAQAAADNDRSLNAEIVHRLKRSFDPEIFRVTEGGMIVRTPFTAEEMKQITAKLRVPNVKEDKS